ncbi:MAG: aminopeptidase P family protein [Castellaniella sp.]|uniref:aminopeptidase P family protein n=1 Tax=Castellaniella sp. TaxID=1955812 RepID=UPI0011FF2CD4|nr:aminopeptidase P family protein [Castellaniella sp.]TAN30282.1 MAG: aminopeptidase P family protein [Castellaniella sp.]
MKPLATAAARVEALRGHLAQAGLQACWVPTADPHLSEYLPEHWMARAWLSGFDGSAGGLLVAADFAGLWTDSRYWVQAERQLQGSGIVLMRAGAPDVPDVLDWMCAHLRAGDRVAVDGRVLDCSTEQRWRAALPDAGLALVLDQDPVGAIWAGRPALPQAPIREHLAPYACRTRAGNLAAVRQAMQAQGATLHLISSLDDIAWLLNLRGADVDHNPVFLAHALVGMDGVRLYVAPGKIPADLAAVLATDGVALRDYDALAADLAALLDSTVLLVDPARVTAGTLSHAARVHVVRAINPSQLLKSVKTTAEAEHIRETMAQDGAALCEFFAWFESAMAAGESVSELDVDTHITAARARRPGFVSTSFATIAAFNANGAMPHYQATPDSFAQIRGDGLLLIDSGGQYLGGTTDITRVVPVGSPSQAQKEDFTTVLRGHIDLAMARFPMGTPSSVLDTLARMPLWQQGLDYGHGTGHGVGYFLNVHEGPQSISVRAHARPHQDMLAGMLTSNEPGLYRPGHWGIRIESLVLAVPAEQTDFGDFLQFETVTLCPIDTRCVVRERLSENERAWLNQYHRQVRERLLPLVTGTVRDWLMVRTEPL